jgi:hypothetical protein
MLKLQDVYEKLVMKSAKAMMLLLLMANLIKLLTVKLKISELIQKQLIERKLKLELNILQNYRLKVE